VSVANALLRHATRMMPAARADWAAAMHAESAVIEEGEAVIWALGCVIAAYRERIRAMDKIYLFARLGFAFAIAGYGAMQLLPAAMTFAYRTGWTGALEILDGATAGDNWRRFVPLMESTPLLLIVASLASASLFLASSVALVLNRSIAPWLLVSGVILTAAQFFVTHNGQISQHAFSPGEFRMDWIILAVIAVITAASFALFHANRANVS
jgi:hypothetical protein